MNQIHPSAVIGPNVDLGHNNVIGPNAVLLGPLKIGDDNWIGPSVVIGSPPQSRGHKHPRPWDESLSGKGIDIGSRNVIREFSSIQSPTKNATTVGDDCFLMTQIHIPHDAHVGNRVTMANSTHIAGHCVIQDDVTLGLSTSIHQFTVVGKGAMVGMGSVITRHVPPFAMSFGTPAKTHGCNRVGMSRQGFRDSEIDEIEGLLLKGLGKTFNNSQAQIPFALQDIYKDWFDSISSVSN